MSSAVVDEPEVQTFEAPAEDGPAISVDPMMAEGGSGAGTGTSFSEISELPPLKEVYIPPPPPPSASSYQPTRQAAPSVTMFEGTAKQEGEAEGSAARIGPEGNQGVKSVPPRLMLYSLAAAGILILIIGIGMTLYIHNLGSEDDPGATHVSKPVVERTPVQPQASQPAPQAAAPQQPSEPVVSQPAEEAPTEPVATSNRLRKTSQLQEETCCARGSYPGQIAVGSHRRAHKSN